MDLEGLHSFATIAKEKSISKAAQMLHVTQPTLSARIRKLEERMGVKLLDRGWDGVKLTQEGHYFLYYAIQMVSQFNNASAMLNKADLLKFDRSLAEVTRMDRMVIGVDTGLSGRFVYPLVAELQRIRPDLKCKYVSRSSMLLIDLIEYGVIDIGLFYDVKECRHLQPVHLLDDEWVLLCSEEAYRGVIRKDDDLIDVLKHDMFVLFENPIATYVNVWEVLSRLFGSTPDKFQIVDSSDMMLGVVANGQGYTFVPKCYVPELYLEAYPIRMIPFGSMLPALPVYMAYSETVQLDVPIGELQRRLLARYKPGAGHTAASGGLNG
ncbi:LysR family transcriptional regulator [Paenibacillus favisporus]|uniref:LysR family transcriptional regulator n=1 Tax=Paenibacillus favisporus TaxID=221028 RepID=UPI002DB8BED1|nr:LysR family transcriptional regulator [Paenibacillus favisporus]MEC0178512.1 LysR family transcriptional regulator [Paenibacillus favisporus]